MIFIKNKITDVYFNLALEEYLAQFPDLQLGRVQFQELLNLLRKKEIASII